MCSTSNYDIQQACYPFAIISDKQWFDSLLKMSYKRILVHLQQQPGAPPVLAKFTDCILSSLQPDHQHSLQVSVELKEDKLILSHPAKNSTPALLTHPPFCPAFCLTPSQSKAIPDETSKRGVDVGVVVLLETADTHLLLTRRAAHMRTFPGTWVPPGGHVEAGEGLLEAGLRELGEETGLVLPPTTVASSRVLALWESVYPYSLSVGAPKRHHIVTYFYVRSSEHSSALQDRMKLDENEVDAAMWLNPSLASLVATGQMPDNCPNRVELTLLGSQGGQVRGSLPSEVLARDAPVCGKDVERVSSGTRYVLQQWLLAREQNNL